MIEGLVETPLKRISIAGGDVMHGLKAQDEGPRQALGKTQAQAAERNRREAAKAAGEGAATVASLARAKGRAGTWLPTTRQTAGARGWVGINGPRASGADS
jgi:hypothetical protein